ncbi:eukaryotic porin-domain-containing protein [Hyaloraphidium curvatum]|nr:eukaryotic porin-domain-containing protein [Hyaloraphidium curvatum]
MASKGEGLLVPDAGRAPPAYGGVSASDLLGGGKSGLSTGSGAASAGSAVSAPKRASSGLWSYIDRFAHIRERLNLPSPGSFENLHREVRGLLPSLYSFDGGKVELTSLLSPNFQVAHSLSWASQQYPNMYNFSTVYVGDRVFLQGQIDSDATLNARVNYNWFEQPPMPQPVEDPDNPGQLMPPAAPPAPKRQSTTKFQAQLAPAGGNSMLQVEHDYVGSDFSLNVKVVNPNPIDLPPSFSKGKPQSGFGKWYNSTFTGIFVASYLQSVTQNLALGGEFLLQKPTPEVEEQTISLVARYSGKPSVIKELPPPPPGMPPPMPLDPSYTFTATYQPAAGILHASYYHRLNQRAELGSEIQALIGGGRREAVATVGFKVDTIFATIRGSVDTHGKVQTVMEERMAQGLTLQLTGEMDYSKGQGGAGKVGIGFALEI